MNDKYQKRPMLFGLVASLIAAAGETGLLANFVSTTAMAQNSAQDQGKTTAVSGASLQLTGSGLGKARLGMSIQDVERALGVKLSFDAADRKAGILKLRCAGGTTASLPGVEFMFNKGRLIAIGSKNPTITTAAGFKVGDREAAVISKLQNDPTFRREPNRHDDSFKEITLGKVTFKPGKGWEGVLAQFVSKNGVVEQIWVGDANYITLNEYCQDG
jgi:hypothetical protein